MKVDIRTGKKDFIWLVYVYVCIKNVDDCYNKYIIKKV